MKDKKKLRQIFLLFSEEVYIFFLNVMLIKIIKSILTIYKF